MTYQQQKKESWASLTEIANSKIYELRQSEFKFGRSETCDLRINDPHISNIHCKIEQINEHGSLVIKLHDMSSNGTFHNRKEIGKGNCVELRNGDQIHLLMMEEITKIKDIGFTFTINQEFMKDQLAQQFECAICLELMHEPVQVTPCSHSFCGGCLSDYYQRCKDCPSCRVVIETISQNFTAKSTIDIILANSTKFRRDLKVLAQLTKQNTFINKTIKTPELLQKKTEELSFPADNKPKIDVVKAKQQQPVKIKPVIRRKVARKDSSSNSDVEPIRIQIQNPSSSDEFVSSDSSITEDYKQKPKILVKEKKVPFSSKSKVISKPKEVEAKPKVVMRIMARKAPETSILPIQEDVKKTLNTNVQCTYQPGDGSGYFN